MQRIDGLHKNIGVRVNAGAYPAATGDALHRRLEVIRQEAVSYTHLTLPTNGW